MDECLNNHTRDLCLGFQNTIQVVTNSRELSDAVRLAFGTKPSLLYTSFAASVYINLLNIACTWQALVMLTAIMHPVGDALQSCSA